MAEIHVYPIIYRVSTILLVVQDFAGPSTVWGKYHRTTILERVFGIFLGATTSHFLTVCDIENGWSWQKKCPCLFDFPLKVVIFHSYVSLPKGTLSSWLFTPTSRLFTDLPSCPERLWNGQGEEWHGAKDLQDIVTLLVGYNRIP